MNTNIIDSKIKKKEKKYEFIWFENINRIVIRIYSTTKIFEYIRCLTMMTMRTTDRKWRSKRMCPLEKHRNSFFKIPSIVVYCIASRRMWQRLASMRKHGGDVKSGPGLRPSKQWPKSKAGGWNLC